MDQLSKIHLSLQETELVNNTEWIMAKHSIIKKVYEMFGFLQVEMKKEIEPYKYLFPENCNQIDGKISKGENYQSLPYVMLDYPAVWKDDILAIRTMFWWGNFFSVTLQLSSNIKNKFTADKPASFVFLQRNDFFICVNDDSWQHHFREDNYKIASGMSFNEFETVLHQPFFKISKKIPVSEWTVAPKFILTYFKEILEFLQINYQGDKKDPSPEFPKAGFDL